MLRRKYLLDKIPGIFRLIVTLPMGILEKAKLHPCKFHRIVLQHHVTLGNSMAKKQDSCMEIPSTWMFFLSPPQNSTSFLIDPSNFHMLFLQYPWTFHFLHPPPHPTPTPTPHFNFSFFWNSPITQFKAAFSCVCCVVWCIT